MAGDRYVPVDEDGYFVLDGQRLEDPEAGRELQDGLRLTEQNAVVTSWRGKEVLVEAFDAPLVARHLHPISGPNAEIDLPYGAKAEFQLESLSVDEWDRFHGMTKAGIPFVFSRQAQMELFDQLDGFDDESITVRGRRVPVPAWLAPHDESRRPGFWTQIYRTETPGWELGQESPVLPAVLPQLKLSRSRVLVLGCGTGHDAAYFAKQGHTVTAVDFSEEAIHRARAVYGGLENLNLVQSDVFALPREWNGRFDLVFEHTCYCAVSPERRNDLVSVWRQALHDQGHLLGVFFAMEKRQGPPFGGSEWEVRQRLKKDFEFLYWTRWRQSQERRKAKELVVFARRRTR